MREHPLTQIARQRARVERLLQAQAQRRETPSTGRPGRARKRLTALLQRA